jgi:hypothetical protein
MQTTFDILIPVAILAVFLVLCAGLYTLFKGGDAARSTSNKLMRLRVLLQLVAIVLLMAGFWWKSQQS